MNVYLLELIGKWLSLIVITCISFFNPRVGAKNQIQVENENKNKNLTIVNQVITHDTKTIYNTSLPSDTKKVVTQGVDGVVYVDSLTGTSKTVQPMVTEVVEVGTGGKSDYTGRLTGYGADCPGCSKVGNVACHTKNGGKHSLTNNGEYYQDDEYGKVRILAAAREKFPCGTIVTVTKPGMDTFYGVVLDTGGSMITAWKESGTVWMDLAYQTQAAARVGGISGTNIEFSVKRWGW